MEMNTKYFSAVVAAAALAGCCLDNAAKCPCGRSVEDPVCGNWSLSLPYDRMNAGQMTVTRQADGAVGANVLWRWGNPADAYSCKIEGNTFEMDVRHRGGVLFSGMVDGDKLVGKAFMKKDGVRGEEIGDVTGWRNPPVCGKASTRDAKFGEPIDLLADGLDGWKPMYGEGRFGWSVAEEDGVKVLSNKLGLKPDGSWAGGGDNLLTKRDDFYDFNLEYDVRVPAKSNSGVYLRGRYEIQVSDSCGKEPSVFGMASLFGRIAPSKSAERKPDEWQHVSVTLYKRHITIVLNGETVIDDQPVLGVTGGALDANEFVPGPIYLQGDHSDADFRNMILRPAL